MRFLLAGILGLLLWSAGAHASCVDPMVLNKGVVCLRKGIIGKEGVPRLSSCMSAWMVTPTLIATNAHVVDALEMSPSSEDRAMLSIEQAREERGTIYPIGHYDARVVAYGHRTPGVSPNREWQKYLGGDIALIGVWSPVRGVTPLRVLPTEPKVGESLVAVGYPSGLLTFGSGKLINIHRTEIGNDQWVRHDGLNSEVQYDLSSRGDRLAFHGGSSGSIAADCSAGLVVAMTTHISRRVIEIADGDGKLRAEFAPARYGMRTNGGVLVNELAELQNKRSKW